MSRRALYSLIPLVVLVGCSLFPRDADEKRSGAAKPEVTTATCTQKTECTVTVVARRCSADGVVASPDTIHIARGLRDVTITWRLEGVGFTFAPDGISFKDKALASRQFTEVAARSTVFQWLDQNTASGTFRYNIKVRQGGRDCPFHDPIIVND